MLAKGWQKRLSASQNARQIGRQMGRNWLANGAQLVGEKSGVSPSLPANHFDDSYLSSK
jgi:hypothetical protein